MPDSETTLAQLRRRVDQFVCERQWHQFHTPKNLAMSITIEAAELMEHFQWLTAEQSKAIAEQQEKLAEVAEELADVMTYALAMANQLNVDLSKAIFDKIKKNERKYPVSEYRGRYGENDPTPPADAL
jgi:NTP pyrophosphatase (non-canonical NTP hydrolase)